MSSSREPGKKKIPSGLWKQLAAWRSAYVGDPDAPAPAPQNGANGAVPSHSVLVPMEPGLSGSFEICQECGEILLPGAQCSHGPRRGEVMHDEDHAMAGRLLGGTWRVLEPVGGGTFGTFWRGEHHILGMKVGIKVLRRYLTATHEGLRRFHEEAMRVSRLNHPGIVKLLDYGQEEDGTPYLVMEYLRGTPLNKCIHERTLGLDDYVEIVSQVTRALIPAHRGEFTDGDPLVHLDLKPEHIFVERIEGVWHVKVIDFGLAEITGGRREETGAGGGTPLYMGPERFRGIVDPRSDLYSLGIVLYECIAGCRPFEGKHVTELRAAHESQVPLAPGRRQGRLGASSSRKLDSIILSALAKDLDARPRSAEEFLERLESWKRLRAAERESRKWSWRAKRVGAVALGAIAVLFFLLWLAPWAALTTQEQIGPRVELSQEGSGDIAGMVQGFGYADASVFLEVEIDGNLYPISLGTVENGAFRVGWPSRQALASKIGKDRAVHGNHFPAALISRRMGRTVRGPSFEVFLDYKPPEIVAVHDSKNEPLKTEKAKDGLKIWIPSGETSLRVLTDEQLQLVECDGQQVVVGLDNGFQLPEGEGKKQVTCLLVDHAGNKTTSLLVLDEAKKVSIVEPPEGKIYLTHDRTYTIPVHFQGQIGHSQVFVDGTPTGPAGASFTVTFGNVKGKTERQHVKVQAWSILSDSNRPPDVERTAIVERLQRDLDIEVVKEGGVPRVRALEALTHREVDGAHVECTLKVDGEPEKSLECIEGTPVIPEGVRGKLHCIFTARDRYGNESRVSQEFIHPSPPMIRTARSKGGIGTKKLPLHAADCACQPPVLERGNQQLIIETDVDYAYPNDLDWRVLRVRGEESRTLSCFTNYDGSLLCPLRELLGALDNGENTIRLSFFDKTSPVHLLVSKDLLLYVERVNVSVYPESGVVLDPEGKIHLRIDAGEAAIERVIIDGEQSALVDGSGVYEKHVSAMHHDETVVDIEVVASGKMHRLQRTYYRPPVERRVYFFPVEHGGKRFRLALRFQRTSEDDQAFRGLWFSPLYFVPESADGDTRVHAEEKLLALREALKNASWIGPSQNVRFPSSEELHALMQQGFIPAIEGHREWLEGHVDTGHALYAQVVDGAPDKRTARSNDPAHRAAFRALFEYGVPGSRLEPRYAEGSAGE